LRSQERVKGDDGGGYISFIFILRTTEECLDFEGWDARLRGRESIPLILLPSAQKIPYLMPG
jgi:hypothetical protein